MARRKRQLTGSIPFAGEKASSKKSGRKPKQLSLALSALLLAASASGASAVTVQPSSGQGFHLADRAALAQNPSSAHGLGNLAEAGLLFFGEAATDAMRMDGVFAIAGAAEGGLAPLAAAAGITVASVSNEPAEGSSGMLDSGTELRPGASQASASGARGTVAGLGFPTGLQSFRGPSPCHWAHPAFGAAEHRNRCGHHATFVAPPAPPLQLSLSAGGKRAGSPIASPPLPTGPGLPGASPPPDPVLPGALSPTAPGLPGASPPTALPSPVVVPVPVPPAWILLASAAAPLLVRRKR